MKTTSLLLASLAILASNAVSAASISGQGTWETTLQGRDLDDNLSTFEAYYDIVLDITWLADVTSPMRTWETANAWAANLSINGITGWRLPKVMPVDGTTLDDAAMSATDGTEDWGFNISAPGTMYAGSSASEMAHLYYNTLGNKGYCAPSSNNQVCYVQSGGGLTNSGPFLFPSSFYYWSANEFAPDTNFAWGFNFEVGHQGAISKTDSIWAWAVHSGDVATVPVPAAAWLLGSGLLGLIGMVRRKAD